MFDWMKANLRHQEGGTSLLNGEAKRADNAFPQSGGANAQLFQWVLDRRTLDTQRVGDGTRTSVTSPVIASFAAAFSEPELRLYQRIDGEDEELTDDAEVLRLWREPTPFLIGGLLIDFIVTSIAGSGSAYLFKLRDGANRILQLLPLYPSQITPHTPADGSSLIDYWEYQPPGSFEQIRLELEDVIQIRWRLDPLDHRLGYPLLKDQLPEIYADDEAGQFAAGLLANLGIPGVILSPANADDIGPDAEEADLMADEWMSRFGGPNRGRPYIPTGGMRAQIVSWSPQQLDLTNLRRLPEERVSAALGWPAILAGLGAGLDRATYSNAEELREFATEQSLVPKWNLTEKQLTRSLRDDFDFGPDVRLAFDTTGVRALQQDQHELAQRWSTMVAGGWATVAEARRAMNLETEDHHDVFLRGTNEIEVPNTPGGIGDTFDEQEQATREGTATFIDEGGNDGSEDAPPRPPDQ